MSKKIIFFIAAFLLIFSSAFVVSKNHNQAIAQGAGLSTGVHALQGYAWAGQQDASGHTVGIGWIHFNPSLGGVFASTTGSNTAVITGYAWANPRDSVAPTNNIGWLSFNAYSSCGATQPQINLSTGVVTGWAKFISADGSDWDGCVHLNGNATSGAAYGGTVSGTSFTTGSYFWGGPSVVGWIHMCGSGYCVTINPATSTLPTTPNPPSNLRQTNAGICDTSGGVVRLAWNASTVDPGHPAPSGYYVYRYSDSSGNTQVAKLSSYSTTLYDSGLTANTNYYYRISAFSAGAGQEAESSKIPTPPLSAFRASTQCNNSNPALIFVATPPTVPKYASCTLSWTTNFSTTTSCTLTGPGDNKFPKTFSVASGLRTASTTTSPIIRTIDYTLTCGNLVAHATCAVAPSYNEH